MGTGNGVIHSHTSLSTWVNCPRLYKARFVDKRIKFKESPALIRGRVLHEAMEDVFNKGSPLPHEYGGKPEFVYLLKGHGARAEVELAMTAEGQGCGFWDKRAKLRGKIDVYAPVIQQKVALHVDWKTGNPRYTDELQAEVYACLQSITVIEKTLFIWSYFSGEYKTSLQDVDIARKKVMRLIEAVDADEDYHPRPNWKCRFCDDLTCEYNTKG
jgi:hypothetical protein